MPSRWAASSPGGYVGEHGQGFAGGQHALACNARSECLALNQLHGDKEKITARVFGFPEVEHAADIWVRYLARQLDLLAQASDHASLGGEVVSDGLDRDGFAEFAIEGAVDFAHAAAAQECDYSEACG